MHSFDVMAEEQAAKSAVSYSYIGVGYEFADIEDEDFSGLKFFGSAAMTDSVYLLANFTRLESENEINLGFGSDELTTTELTLGLGFHAPVNAQVDFIADLSYAEQEVEYQGISVEGDGFVVNTGFRGKPSEIFEFGALLNYIDIEDEDETGVILSGRLFAGPNFSFGATYSTANDIDSIGINARFDFQR